MPVKNVFAQSWTHPATASPQPASVTPRPATASPYPVGYRPIFLTDSGRLYRPNALLSENGYYRPIEIDLWYPAANERQGKPIAYGEFISLLEQRSNRFQKDTVYNGLTNEMVQYLASNLQMEDTATLTRFPTSSFRNAQPADQRFPLIIYMCSFNGMSYENINLFEWLAGHGYVVACITSVGRYPGNMTTQPADLFQQVDDGIFSIRYLKDRALVDSTRIGVAGYSWGGLAALILAMRSPAVKAVLSLDGSEMHYYGESKEEDGDFDQLRKADFFNANHVTIPYMYLESGQKQSDREVDSIFNILPSLQSPKKYARFSSASHEDFSGLMSLGKITTFDQLSLDYFEQHFRGKPDLQGTSDSKGTSNSNGRPDSLERRLDALFRQGLADSSYPHPAVVRNGKQVFIRGRVLDRSNKAPLAFVNVGVPEENIGTVTGHSGNFVLKIDSSLDNDSLRISMVGYQAQTVPVRQLLKQPADIRQQGDITIFLDQKATELQEAIVTSRTPRKKIEGNRTTSKFISIGFPLRFLGAELGIRVNLGKHPARLRSFHFNIASSRIDSAIFRLNIYDFKKGSPHLNLLSKSILVPIGKKIGAYTVDLTAYSLIAKGEALLSLELVETFSSGSVTPAPSSPAPTGAVYFSAGFLNSAAWHRQTSQGRWKKAGGLGVGFNVEIF